MLTAQKVKNSSMYELEQNLRGVKTYWYYDLESGTSSTSGEKNAPLDHVMSQDAVDSVKHRLGKVLGNSVK